MKSISKMKKTTNHICSSKLIMGKYYKYNIDDILFVDFRNVNDRVKIMYM